MAITAERLRSLMSYDPETGVFVRLVFTSPNAQAGTIIGTVAHNGYLTVSIDGRRYSLHRLAFLFMTGVWPAADLDHKDGDRANNRWANLRQATRSQNLANMRMKASNTSGVKGVVWDKCRQKWRAQISIGGKVKNLGRFDTKEQAAAHHRKAAMSANGEFARLA